MEKKNSQFFTTKNSIELEQINFSYSFKPVYFLSSLFGCFPFTIVRNQSNIIIGCCVGVFDIVLLLLNIALHMITAGLSCPTIGYPDSYLIEFIKATTPLSVTGNNIFPLGQNIAAVISSVLDLLNRNRFIEIFKAFDSFDKEVYY